MVAEVEGVAGNQALPKPQPPLQEVVAVAEGAVESQILPRTQPPLQEVVTVAEEVVESRTLPRTRLPLQEVVAVAEAVVEAQILPSTHPHRLPILPLNVQQLQRPPVPNCALLVSITNNHWTPILLPRVIL